MKQRRTLKTLAFAILLSSSIISFTGVAHADCPAGQNSNQDYDIATGITTYYCTVVGDPNPTASDPNLNNPAPVVNTPAPVQAPAPVVNPCPVGQNNNVDVNVTTGVATYFCTLEGDPNPTASDPNLANSASVATPDPSPSVAPTVTPVMPTVDPFPLLATGDQIPGTLVDGQQAISCPDGSGSAIDVNVASGSVTTYCTKNWISPEQIAANLDFQQRLSDDEGHETRKDQDRVLRWILSKSLKSGRRSE